MEEKIGHEKSNSSGLYRIFPIHATTYDFKATGKLNEKRLRMNLEKERLFRRDGFGENYASATPLAF